MRKAVHLLALAGLPLLAAACFSSSSGGSPSGDAGDDGASPDAASTSEPDAGLPSNGDAAADAKADGSSASTDAGGSSADAGGSGPEASTPDAPAPVVTVVVSDAHGPEQGVNVVFQDGYGQALATAPTDGQGRASYPLPAGSQVTVLMGTGTAPLLETIQAVGPSGVLQVYDPSADSSIPSPQVSLTLDPDAGAPPGTASFHGSIGACSFFALPATLTLQPDCMSGGQFPVLAVAQAGQDGGNQDLAYSVSRGNTLAPDDAGVTNVVVGGPWYTDMWPQTIGLVNAPAGSQNDDLWFGEVGSGVLATGGSLSGYITDVAAPTAVDTVHPRFADAVQIEANVDEAPSVYGTPYGLAISGIASRGPVGDGGPSILDLSQALPFLDSLNVDTTVPAQPVLSFGSSTGALSGAKAVIAQMTWSDTVGNSAVSGSWTIVSPGTVTLVTAPPLPAIASSLVPTSTAIMNTPVVVLVDPDFAASYEAIVSQAVFLELPPQLNQVVHPGYNVAPPLPVDGTLRYTAIMASGD